jgi:hypothetical protein
LHPFSRRSRAARFDFATINASQGLILRESGKPLVVMTFEIEDGQIRVLRLIAKPDKLTRVDRKRQST